MAYETSIDARPRAPIDEWPRRLRGLSRRRPSVVLRGTGRHDQHLESVRDEANCSWCVGVVERMRDDIECVRVRGRTGREPRLPEPDERRERGERQRVIGCEDVEERSEDRRQTRVRWIPEERLEHVRRRYCRSASAAQSSSVPSTTPRTVAMASGVAGDRFDLPLRRASFSARDTAPGQSALRPQTLEPSEPGGRRRRSGEPSPATARLQVVDVGLAPPVGPLSAFRSACARISQAASASVEALSSSRRRAHWRRTLTRCRDGGASSASAYARSRSPPPSASLREIDRGRGRRARDPGQRLSLGLSLATLGSPAREPRSNGIRERRRGRSSAMRANAPSAVADSHPGSAKLVGEQESRCQPRDRRGSLREERATPEDR